MRCAINTRGYADRRVCVSALIIDRGTVGEDYAALAWCSDRDVVCVWPNGSIWATRRPLIVWSCFIVTRTCELSEVDSHIVRLTTSADPSESITSSLRKQLYSIFHSNSAAYRNLCVTCF